MKPVHLRRLGPALAVTMAATLGLAAPATAQPDYPFRDPDLPLEKRIDDLLGRLTLDGKIAFLHQYQPAIPRLGIRLNKNGTEALHGLAWTNHYQTGEVVTATATVFPQAVGLASTWDPALIQRVGSAVAAEARGYHSKHPRVWGLNVWAPVVDLLRDPRWGRNEEGYSEDPYLAGTMATAYAGGLRGDHPFYLKTAPTLKHYTGYSAETNRDTVSASLRPRVRHEYYDVPFRMPIQAGAATGVMTSYNLVNGRPMTAHPDVGDVVRGWTDETLMNVTDAFAPANLTGSQDYFATQAQANAAVLKAGVDSFTQDGIDADDTVAAIRKALEQGLITEEHINTAVRHILSIRFRLGEFDPNGGPYADITMDVVNSPQHRRLARKAAAEAMVLLKNTKHTLPLDPAAADRVAVIGPVADTLYTDWYSGAMPYEVTPAEGITRRLGPDGTVTTTEGVDRIALRAPNGKYVTAPGGKGGGPLAATAESVGDAQALDVFGWGEGVVTLRAVANGKYVTFGEGRTLVNSEAQPNGWFVQEQFKLVGRPNGGYVIEYAGNEVDDSWFGDQKYVVVEDDGTLTVTATTAEAATTFTTEVLRSGVDAATRAASGADAAVVVVGTMPFINGREDDDRSSLALAESQLELVKAVREANPNTVVVLESSYPMAITWMREHVPSILWTTHAGQETGNALAAVLFGDRNPAGRLTQTWYRFEEQLPDIREYDIIKHDRTYLYFDGDPLYPFGYGLSYTTFEYGNLRVSDRSVRPKDTVTVSVDVTNTGAQAGDEVVQLYSHQRRSRVKQAARELRVFQRVHLAPGETRTVRLSFDARDLAFWDVTQGRWVVESSAHDLMVGSSSADIRDRATLHVRGERIPPRDLSQQTRAADFDGYSGTELVDTSKARGVSVGATDGDWLEFADVDLRSAPTTVTARVAKESAGTAVIEVRLDDPEDGKLLGTVEVPSTGDRYTYTTVTAEIDRAARGRHHEIYLVFRGDLRIHTFSLR